MGGLHKLNAAFFDSSRSCASQTTSMVVSQWIEPGLQFFGLRASESLLNLLVQYAPYAAVATEFLILPLTSLNFPRCFVTIGVCFHIFLAVPFPPSSYYPFSLVSLALYPF